MRLRCRCPFVPALQNLLDNLARLGIHASEWKNHKWKVEYCENASRLRVFVPGTGARPVGMSLCRDSYMPNALDFEAIAEAQKSDADIQSLCNRITSLQLKSLPVRNSPNFILCDVSQDTPRILLPKAKFQK